MKRRRQAVKARNIARINDRSVRKLYKEVERQVQIVNDRLSSLERKHASGTWASRKLFTRVKNNKTKGLLYKGKRIRLKPKMNKTNLVQLQKATRQFLDSATSTNKGINKIKKKTIESLKGTLNFNQKEKLSDKDVESMYKILEDEGYKAHLMDMIPPSLLWQELSYCISHNLGVDTFISRLNKYLEQDMDLDLQEEARRIFETYVL